MQSGVVNIRGREYKTVALRVQEFREKCPAAEGWSISTEVVIDDGERVVVKAMISGPECLCVAMGHAEERRDAGQINKTSALENCETSAIGRALAAFGLAGAEYASANEVEQAVHQQAPFPREEKTRKKDNRAYVANHQKLTNEATSVDTLLALYEAAVRDKKEGKLTDADFEKCKAFLSAKRKVLETQEEVPA